MNIHHQYLPIDLFNNNVGTSLPNSLLQARFEQLFAQNRPLLHQQNPKSPGRKAIA
jgi:hypothetical protein